MTGEAESAHNECNYSNRMCEICRSLINLMQVRYEGLHLCAYCFMQCERIKQEHNQRRWKEKQRFRLITDNKQE